MVYKPHVSRISDTDFLVVLCSCTEIILPSALPFGSGSADWVYEVVFNLARPQNWLDREPQFLVPV